MTDGPFPSALRELRTDFRKRPVIVGMLALGLILGISGPFGTFDTLAVVPRVLYWIAIVVLTYGAGTFVGTFVHRALERRLGWMVVAVSTVAIGIAVLAIITVVNLAVFGVWFDTWASFLRQWALITVISGVIEVSSYLLRAEGPAPSGGTPLLDRLPFDKRGAIIALSAEDHYVRIETTKGAELVLMRLSDAVKEVGQTAGLQVHRSHWVAIDQIKKVARIGDRGEITLKNGSTRPISRGFMGAVRDAGLLPMKGSAPLS